MPTNRLTLVVGASGRLGSNIVRQLHAMGVPVRAVVRSTTDEQKRDALRAHVSELCHADLKDPESIRDACRGVNVVISTATSISSTRSGDSIQAVDHEGQVRLVDIAESEGVERFVLVSFPPGNFEHPLQTAKRAVEDRLCHGKMSYVILQATKFMETWLGPALGFDPVHGRARIPGPGTQSLSWVALHDVARFAAAASIHRRFLGRSIQLCGPRPVSYLDVVRTFEKCGSPKIALEHIPESELQRAFELADTPLKKTYAALMLGAARGHSLDPSVALQLLPGQLRSVEQYAEEVLDTHQPIHGGIGNAS
jgi:uncharacterized protein YbjT (DUF2867 family)